jgi:hypothetical protein
MAERVYDSATLEGIVDDVVGLVRWVFEGSAHVDVQRGSVMLDYPWKLRLHIDDERIGATGLAAESVIHPVALQDHVFHGDMTREKYAAGIAAGLIASGLARVRPELIDGYVEKTNAMLIRFQDGELVVAEKGADRNDVSGSD